MHQCRACKVVDTSALQLGPCRVCGGDDWRKVGAEARRYIEKETERLKDVAETNIIPEEEEGYNE